MSSSREQDQKNIMNLFQTRWLIHALHAVVKLDIADEIGDQSVSIEKLAQRIKANQQNLYRLMRALSSNGFFIEEPEGTFSHNELSQELRKNAESGLRSMLELTQMESMQKAWNQLPESIMTGVPPFESANGTPIFRYLAQHPKDALIFNQAMVDLTSSSFKAILKGYPEFKNKRKILDIAGGLGQMLAYILKENPDSQGAVLDLPELESSARNYLKEKGLDSRARFIPGNFHNSLPDGFDLYMIKNALFNWPDTDVSKVLKNIRNVVEKGRFLIIESLICKENAAQSTMMDLQMLVAPNGRCRTETEYAKLLKEADLKILQIYQANGAVGDFQIIECATA